MKEYLKKLVSSTDPESAMRWVFIFTAIFTTLMFWGTWIIISIYNQSLSDMPSGAVTAYSTVNGTNVLGKVVQKFAEKE